jgi:hypothetical protein
VQWIFFFFYLFFFYGQRVFLNMDSSARYCRRRSGRSRYADAVAVRRGTTFYEH